MFLRVSAHIPKLFVFIPGYDLVDHSGYAICNGDFCLVCRA
jgi:hypothetical protein